MLPILPPWLSAARPWQGLTTKAKLGSRDFAKTTEGDPSCLIVAPGLRPPLLNATPHPSAAERVLRHTDFDLRSLPTRRSQRPLIFN